MLSFNEQFLQEKQIQFSNGAKYGQVVFLGGGGGSGKDFALEKFMSGSDFHTFDVDHLKELILQQARAGKPEYAAIKDINMGNPKDLFKLHVFVKNTGIMDHIRDTFENAHKNTPKDRLPNICINITLKDLEDLDYWTPMLHRLGYQPVDTHLCWIMTSYEQAQANNAKRGAKPGGRFVDPEVIAHAHEGAARTILGMFNGKIPPAINGKVVVILNNPSETKWWDDTKRNAKNFTYAIVKLEGKPMSYDAPAPKAAPGSETLRQKIGGWARANVPPAVFQKRD